jgi:uncharacterized protein (TIGR00369 family)
MNDSTQPDLSASMGFDETLGLQIDGVSSTEVTGHLDPVDRHRQPYGLVHGGVYCAIVESLGSVGSAAYAMERGMLGAVGLSNSTDFLRSHREGRLEARATPIHQGRSQQLWQVAITRAVDGKLVARGQLRTYNLVSDEAIGAAGS